MRNLLGEPDIAIDRTARAMRLSPLGSMRGYQILIATAHFMSGRYDEALSWAERSLRPDPNYAFPWRIVAASHALAGHGAEAKAACVRVRELEPLLRLSNFRDVTGPYRPADLTRLEEGLRKAGLPE